MNAEFFDWVKRRTLVGISSNPRLRNALVLKGGSLLDIAFNVKARISIDLDFSIEGDLVAEEALAECEAALKVAFAPEGYRVIDVRIIEKPPTISEELKDFWGGYSIEFKLVTAINFAQYKDDLGRMRRIAVPISINGSTILRIDISKFEYCEGKQPFNVDGTEFFGYSPEMVVAEKLRAICQQMPEYRQMVKKHLAGRARDFVDLHMLIQEFHINLANPEFHEILRSVFAAKKVPLRLLGKITHHREDHQGDFVAVLDTIRPGFELEDLDFYVDFIVRECQQLEPLWNV
jgi:hypothetical protein